MKRLIFILAFLCLSTTNAQNKLSISNYFNIPESYKRIATTDYHKWLINKEIKIEEVLTYDGYAIYGLGDYYAAKFDYNIGKRNLHQCADAAMYFRAWYHFDKGNINKIVFTFTDGTVYSYSDFLKQKKLNNTFKSFNKYMTIIWSYAGTWSINKYDTKHVSVNNISAGDIFVIGGFPGHAITIVDVIENECGDKKIMLSQSFMPAQDHHILINPSNNTVWFSIDEVPSVGFSFTENNLKRFKI